MSFWSRIFRAIPALPSIEHPLFGRIDATIDHGDGTYFWETQNPLPTPKGRIGIFCDAPEGGPSDTQVQLWHHIYQNAEVLAKSAETLLRDRLADFKWDNRFSELVWEGVGLSPDGNRKGKWDLSFDLGSEAIFTVSFENGVPTVVSVDD